MDVHRYTCPKQFLQRVEPFLLRNEAVNNLPLGIVYALTKNTKDNADVVLATVENETGVQLVMVRTALNLVLASEETVKEEALHKAVAYFHEGKIQLPGVIGANDLAYTFQLEWQKRAGNTSEVAMHQRIYRLDQVNEINYSPGDLRLATKGDLPIIADWIYDFAKVTPEPVTYEAAEKLARASIEAATVYLWIDQKIPVSMAKKTRPTKNGIVVNLVYTPPKFRKKGYASSCVACLTKLLLDDGYKFTSLYTDLANPTSNKIYMDIGYKAVADSIVFKFT